MILPKFKYHQPTTLNEAFDIAKVCESDFDFIAGGTDVLPNYKNRLNNRNNVISLNRIKELFELNESRIGSLVTLVQLATSDSIQKNYPVIAKTSKLIASPLLRESATVGGNILLDTRCWYFNQSHLWRLSKGFCLKADGDDCLVVPQKEICYATYSGDLAPVFMVLEAKFHFAGSIGKREITAGDFFTPDGITRYVKKPDEILTHITLPEESSQLRSAYRKLRIRDSIDYPVMGTAVALRLNEKTIEELRIAVTGTNSTPLLFNEITEKFRGDQLTVSLIANIANEIMDEVTPYKNVHFSPQYRKAMVGVYLKRILTKLIIGGR